MVAEEIPGASEKLVLRFYHIGRLPVSPCRTLPIGRAAIVVAEIEPAIYADDMSLSAKARRRWFGALCLIAAIGMLAAGETVLKGRLSPLGFLCYWAGCFVIAALAAMAALLDAACVRAESRREQRALFEETLRRIEAEKRARSDTQR